MTAVVRALPANSTIGIIGGGQLGRLLAIAAANLGFRTIVLEPAPECPASQVCNAQITASYDDQDALGLLADQCDVVTYEFENVPLIAAEIIAQNAPLYPPARALEVSQDRIVEKTFLENIGVSVANFASVENKADALRALQEFDGGVLKTRRFGYDGKGQHVFQTVDQDDVSSVIGSLGDGTGAGLIVEKLINFDFEFSLIGARALDGHIRVYAPAQNVHDNGILRKSNVPAQLTGDQGEQAVACTQRILNELNYVGVIGVEFFATQHGLLVNEIAPRVHNTGHWTVEACIVGQFEQHVRAIAGMPLGSTTLHSPRWEMENLLGNEIERVDEILADEQATLTLYGKAEAREGRKMGHVTKQL